MRRFKCISPLTLIGLGLHPGQGRGRALVKLTICLLTFLFIIGPVWSARAQAVEESVISSDQGSSVAIEEPVVAPLISASVEPQNTPVDQVLSAPVTPLSLPEPLSIVDSDAANDDVAVDQDTTLAQKTKTDSKVTTQSATSMNALASTDSLNSSGQVGSAGLKQSLPEPDTTTGALVYRFPLTIPPGRNNVQPDLTLTYNSQSGEEGSIFGYSWSISIPSIERLNKRGAEQMYARNDFTSSLSGELVDLGGGNYGSKVESGEFLNYEFASNIWTVRDKKGTTYKFGATIQARQDNPADPSKIYKWMLEETRDVNDNFVRYEYYKDQGQIYPYKIFYTGNGSGDGIFEVELFKQPRQDINKVNKSAFTVSTTYIINEILIKINTSWVSKYKFIYGVGDNATSSVLQSIQETHRDETSLAEVSLPLTQFNYEISTKSWTQQTVNPALPNNLFFNSYYNGADKGGRILDVNGDGLQDLLISFYDGANNDQRIYLNNGTNWVLSNEWIIPSNFWTAQVNEQGVGTQIADVNGDILPDLLVSYDQGGGNKDQRVYLNNGVNGWALQTTSWQLPNIFFWQSNNTDPGGRIGDINGDGLTDLFISHYCPTCYPTPLVDQRVYLNNGSGWTQNASWLFPEDLHLSNYYNGKDQGTRLLDINSDGLLDAVTNFQYDRTLFKKRVYLNTGFGWLTDTTSWILPNDVVFADWNGFDLGWRAVDINSDGLPDLLKSFSMSGVSYQKVYLNNGKNGWVDVTPAWSLPDFRFADYQTGWDQGVRVLDINGDNLEDIVISQYENAGGHNQRVFFHNGNKPNQLLSISYNTGGVSEIVYKTTPLYKTGGVLLNSKLPIVLQTVSDITVNDGFGGTITSSYVYEGGWYWYSNPFDKKFAGFGKIVKADIVGNKTITYYHQGNATNSVLGEYDDHSSKIGYPYRIEQQDAAGNLYNVTISQWDKYSLGNGRSFVNKIRQTALTYDGNATHHDVAETFTYDNANGNLLSQVKWGEVSANSDGSFTDISNDKLTTLISYVSGGSYSVTGLPATLLTMDQVDSKVSEIRNYYDLLPLGFINKGNETKTEFWISDSNYADTQKTYNNYGLVTQELDARDKPTNYVYDAYNLYPATVTNALNQQAQYQYDYSLGKPKQVADANGAINQTIYDGLDRVVEQKQSDRIIPDVLITSAMYVYTHLPVGLQTQEIKYLNVTASVDAYSYTDGLGRTIQSRVEAETPGQFAVSDVVYNSRGLKEKESLLYFSSGTARTAPSPVEGLYTTYTYDAVGRVTSARNAIGTVTNTFTDWKTTIVDARGNPIYRYQDAYGRLVRVDEVNDSSTYTTVYEYNGLSLLAKITDALGNIRTFAYDGLGRRLTAQDLHAPGDTTFGIWTYSYDAAGNLITKLDPKNQSIVYTYDDLNRVLTEDFIGQTGVEVTYAYDTCLNGKGRLCSIIKADVTETRQYDALGNVAREIKNISGTPYQTDYNYDQQGNQVLLANPDSSQVKYIYNTAGQLEQVQRKETTDGSFVNVVSNFNYGPSGQLVLQQNANGTSTTNNYDSAKMYRLSSKLTTNSGGARLQDLAYTYDLNSNIVRIVDASATNSAKTVDYTYDALNRLTSATVTGAVNSQNYTQAYTYDAIGNILSGPAGNYTYAGSQGESYANPHAVTDVSGTAYTYDNNGNMTSAGSRIYTWDFNNRLIQASVPDQSPVAATANFYPASGDGSTAYQNSNNWNTTHNAVTGNIASATSTVMNVNTGKYNSTKYKIERAFLPFNTSGLPDNATITSAKLKVYVVSKLNNDNDGSDWVTVVQGFEPSITTLTTADYDLAGTVHSPAEGVDAGERKDITSVATGQYLTFNLNTIGRSWISLTESTKLALREGHDVLDTPFVGSSGKYNQLQIRTAQYSGTTYDPILEVTYTTPPAAATIAYVYDAFGQRVKITNGGVTTVYPTANYNTDGITAQKHIMAANVVATIKGTGASAVSYYVATDHLTGSNIVTTSSGTQEELMDYYPFGSIRLDEKAGSFSEQRKYAGQEYDVDTGLSYMNARYYNGTLGRFITQDPLEIIGFQTTDPKRFVSIISNPQNWNTYSYALNNPLVKIDPTGLYTTVVHGTLPLENMSNARAAWQDPSNPLIQNASQTFGEKAQLFEWSGGDNHWERLYAASQLAAEINAHTFQPGEQLNLVTHSHGGNIAFLVSQMIDKKIDNLVTFALPVRADYQPDSSNISNMVNVYSQSDLAQVMAGGTYSMSGLLGRAFGDMGEKIGNYLGLGEFGFAGYKVQGAKNIDVTRYSWNPLTAHTSVWQSTKAWNQGVVPNVIKK